MFLSRHELLRLIGLAGLVGLNAKSIFAERLLPNDPCKIPRFCSVRLIYLTDTHAQLLPVYFREPNVNLGIGGATGRVPHRVGSAFLEYFGISPFPHSAWNVSIAALLRILKRNAERPRCIPRRA